MWSSVTDAWTLARARGVESAGEHTAARPRVAGSVPGHYGPRAPHPDERRARDGGAPERHGAHRRAARVHRRAHVVGALAAPRGGRHPRLLGDRVGALAARVGTVLSAPL